MEQKRKARKREELNRRKEGRTKERRTYERTKEEERRRGIRCHLQRCFECCYSITRLRNLIESYGGIRKLNKQKDCHVGEVLNSSFYYSSHPDHDRHRLPQLFYEYIPDIDVIYCI